MAEQHAKLSASSSAKWLTCPGALALEYIIDEPDTGSPFAQEGTAGHAVLEKTLVKGVEPSVYLGEIMVVDEGTPQQAEIEVNQEMIDAVEVVTDYVRRLRARSAFYEKRVDYSHIAPEGFGTADICLEVYEKTAPDTRINTLYVIDFKYGKGVKVDAFENTQGMLYGLGALNTLDLLFEREIERVVIVIAQPRVDSISEYTLTVDELKAWGEDVAKPKAILAHDIYQAAQEKGEIVLSEFDFNPTEKGCQWCQGRTTGRCKALAKAGYAAAVEGFTDLTAEEKADIAAVEVATKDPALMDLDDMAAVYLAMKTFINFAGAVEDRIRELLSAGHEVPGLALVDTERPRAWRLDEENTIKALRTAGLQKKHYEKINIVSPTQAEKLLKRVKPNEFKRRYRRLEEAAIHRPAGMPKIVQTKTKAERAEGLDELDDLLS